MTTIDLVKELKQKGIELTFSGCKLKYNGPEENITPEIIQKLKDNKSALIKYLWPAELKGLMPINPVGNKTPFFIIHGDKGNYIISDYFGADQPVYGFFHPGSEGEEIPFTNVKTMASEYLKEVQTLRSTGDYYFIGYSFGGLLAYEMAIQLQKAGHKVPFLVLIDSVCPLAKEKIRREKNFFTFLRKNILGPARRKIKREYALLICNLYVLLGRKIPAERRTFYVWIKYLKMTDKYKPEKFSGEILLFRTTGNPCSDSYLGWESLADSIKLVEMSGKHLDVFVGKERIELLQKEIEKHLFHIINLETTAK